MAGASSGEAEENYWPGYVDALTTMTMVLTFIMMVLGVVIFAMSQNISKTLIQAVATAAKVKVANEGTADEQAKKLVAAIQAQTQAREAPPPEPVAQPAPQPVAQAPAPQASQAGPPASGPPPALDQQGGPVRAAEKDAPVAPAVAATQAAPIFEQPTPEPKPVPAPPAAPVQTPVTDGKGSMQSGREQGMPAAPQAEKKRIESTAVMPEQTKLAGATGLSRSGPIVTIQFKPHAVELDKDSLAEFKAIFADPAIAAAQIMVDVRAYADKESIAVTEARRVAYYRAMLVRTALIGSGIDARRITVRVEDGAPADTDLVRIFLGK
jgi:hypothetical protein